MWKRPMSPPTLAPTADRAHARPMGTGAVAPSRGRPSVPGPAWVSIGSGAVATAVGAGLVRHLVEDGLTPTAVTAVVLLVAGLALLVSGAVRTMRPRRWPGRTVVVVGTLLFTALVLMIVGPAVLATNVPPTDIEEVPADRGLDAQDVTFRTDDGVDLAGWYVTSSNGAAVVVRHGAGSTRSDVLAEAEVLARHGYGVLLVDARGHGESDGDAMDFGWNGDADTSAATRWLAARPEVDPERIGVLGSSMGGEEAIGAAAADARIRAVVAEGATGRTADDKTWLSEEYGARGWAQEQIEWVQYALTDLLTAADRPRALRDAIRAADRTPFLLITAGAVDDEGHAAAHMAAGLGDRVEVWTVEGAGHTDGLAVDPAGWEARVVGFFDEHL
jgi:dienelactone hydrolase